MSEYSNPSNTEFKRAEQSILDALSTSAPNLMTKVGSVIRELVVRPAALLYAWVTSNADKHFEERSVTYLKTSNATDNETADTVAANYFVYRREGVRAKGVITVYTTFPVVQLPAGASFSVNGIQVVTDSSIVASDTLETGKRNNTIYIRTIKLSDGLYLANIPVVAQQVGDIEIAAGAEVTMNFIDSTISSALLTSPITGGSGTETDAELMARAEYNTAESGVGSYYGIKRRLQSAPVAVLDIGLIAGEDTLLFRARHNSVNINPGGYVDCYVKTQKQASVSEVSAYVDKIAQDSYKIEISPTDAINVAGFFGVLSISVNIGETTYQLNQWSMDYGDGSNASGDAKGARLSRNQSLVITFTASDNGIVDTSEEAERSAVVTVSYMPGINALQNYLDDDKNKFVGQDIRVKAAVPVVLHFDCEVQSSPALTDDETDMLKRVISSCASAYRVGTSVFNFSDVRKACYQALPRAELRLPCTISAEILTANGVIDTFHSTSGILDISNPVNQDYWSPAVCFFSLNPENIRLEQV